jgi:hypothetical protein
VSIDLIALFVNRTMVPATEHGEVRERGEAPALTGVELADEIQQACGGSVEVRRQLGDLVDQPVQLDETFWGSKDMWRMDVHREAPFCWGDSTPPFPEPPARLQKRRFRTGKNFFGSVTFGRHRRSVRPAERDLRDTGDTRDSIAYSAVKRKS